MSKNEQLKIYVKRIKQYSEFIDADFEDDENIEIIKIIEDNLNKIKYILNY